MGIHGGSRASGARGKPALRLRHYLLTGEVLTVAHGRALVPVWRPEVSKPYELAVLAREMLRFCGQHVPMGPRERRGNLAFPAKQAFDCHA